MPHHVPRFLSPWPLGGTAWQHFSFWHLQGEWLRYRCLSWDRFYFWQPDCTTLMSLCPPDLVVGHVLCFVYSWICPSFLSFFVLLSVLLPLGYVKYFLNQSLLRRLTSAAGVDFRKRPIDDTAHTCEWVWTRVGSDLGNVNQENFQNVTGNTFLCSLMDK